MTFGRAKSSRASSTLPSLLVHILRVLADVSSLSNYFIAVVPRSAAGGVGKRAFDSVANTPTDVSQAGNRIMRDSNGRGRYLVHALHRVCPSQTISFDPILTCRQQPRYYAWRWT